MFALLVICVTLILITMSVGIMVSSAYIWKRITCYPVKDKFDGNTYWVYRPRYNRFYYRFNLILSAFYQNPDVLDMWLKMLKVECDWSHCSFIPKDCAHRDYELE